MSLVGLAAAGAALAWPAFSRATGAELPCPLRSSTGVPCPLCGMTTAGVALVRGDLDGALAANPFGLVLAVLTVAALVVLALRRMGWLSPPAPWGREAVLRCVALGAVAAVASELWQLQRAGWL